jgi:hypothetical protein
MIFMAIWVEEVSFSGINLISRMCADDPDYLQPSYSKILMSLLMFSFRTLGARKASGLSSRMCSITLMVNYQSHSQTSFHNDQV